MMYKIFPLTHRYFKNLTRSLTRGNSLVEFIKCLNLMEMRTSLMVRHNRLTAKLLLFCFSFVIVQVQAQINVYDCTINSSTPSQTTIHNENPLYARTCINLATPHTYNFQGGFYETVQASEAIHITSDFKAHNYGANGGMHLLVLPHQDLNIVCMNYNDLDVVVKLDKFEIGIELPADILTKVNNYVLENASVPNSEKLNPFLDRELKIVAEFTSNAPSNITKTVDGFYYREYERNVPNRVWDDQHTNYQFRIRYAPPSSGKYTCVVKFYVNNILTITSNPFDFKVVESGNPGYVKKHRNGRNFALGNNMIFPVGQNLPHPINPLYTVAPDLPEIPDYRGEVGYKAPSGMWEEYLQDVSNYGDQGGRYVRAILSPSVSSIEFEKLGNYYDRLDYAWEMDNVVNICTQKKYVFTIGFNVAR